MKTWRQLEAMAREHGFTLTHGDCTWSLGNDEVDDMARGEWWCSSARENQRILRAMCEAALGHMGSTK